MAARPDISYDAVIIVPGVMGSRLKEVATGDLLWGFSDMHRYTRLWLGGGAYQRLAVTPEERAGKLGRVVPDGILHRAAVAPILRGTEGYTKLVDAATSAVAHPAAVRQFAYDWRLSVEHNARCLACAARTHIDLWRNHEVHRRAPTSREPRLVIVAHSMGGLLARALSVVEGRDGTPEITNDVRATVTLGTPFSGTVKAAVLLETGKGTPLKALAHKRRMRTLATTLPGIYDLLPAHRCIEDANDVRMIHHKDVAAIGGNEELAHESIERSQRLRHGTVAGHRAMVGTGQRTLQSMRFDNGVIIPSHDEFEWDGDQPARDELDELIRREIDGDETVARDSAVLAGAERQYLTQQHGALAYTREAVDCVADIIRERADTPYLGAGGLGIDVPDVVAPHEEWAVTLTGVDSFAAAGCVVRNAESRERVPTRLEWRDGQIQALLRVRVPGVYRVAATGGGTSPVTQLVLAAEPDV